MQRAHEQGVNVLALCDHDTVMGIDEAKIEADKLGIELLMAWKFQRIGKVVVSILLD